MKETRLLSDNHIILTLASNRISVREYSNEPIRIEDVFYAINAARNAPSGANKQPWRFVIVTKQSLKDEIRKLCEEAERELRDRIPDWFKKWLKDKGISWRKKYLSKAPVLVLVFGRTRDPYWLQSVWLAIGYMLLALEERGLASLTYTPPKIRWANRLLNVPDEYVLQTIVVVGKPAKEIKREKERLNLHDVVFCENWGNPCANTMNNP